MANSTPIRLIVFDWAGTTIDFGSRAPALAFVEVFRQRNVRVSYDEARAPMGLHKRDHLWAMFQMPTVADRWLNVHDRSWTESDIDEMYQELIPLQLETISQCNQLIPELLDTVAHLRRRGLFVAGSTGYFPEATQRVADAAREQGFVPDFNIGADEVPSGRPAPWMIFRAMEAVNVISVFEVVNVGDTIPDVQAGRNAGVWSVAVVDSSSSMGCSLEEWQALSEDEQEARREPVKQKFLSGGAHAAINTLTELPALLDEFEQRLKRGERP